MDLLALLLLVLYIGIYALLIYLLFKQSDNYAAFHPVVAPISILIGFITFFIYYFAVEGVSIPFSLLLGIFASGFIAIPVLAFLVFVGFIKSRPFAKLKIKYGKFSGKFLLDFMARFITPIIILIMVIICFLTFKFSS